MPNDFLQCVITSPPYYGLRSYKTEPQIWDGDENCTHVWGEYEAKLLHENRQNLDGGTLGNPEYREKLHGFCPSTAAFCQQCSAWRGELGLEPTFQLYISHLIDIFREVKRVLKPDGCVFVNLGDSYCSSGGASRHFGYQDPKYKNGRDGNHIEPTAFPQSVRPKSLMNIPHRFFIGMTDELQFIQRNNINWWKRACMPSSAKDRWTVDFESIGFFTKNERYTFNQQLDVYTAPLDRWGGEELVANGAGMWDAGTGQSTYRNRNMRPNPNGRNQRTTWDIPFEPSGNEHYASYPTRLVERMILAGSNEGDVVYDCFGGTATTAVTAHKLRRQWLCSELQPKYVDIANERLEPYLAQNSLF